MWIASAGIAVAALGMVAFTLLRSPRPDEGRPSPPVKARQVAPNRWVIPRQERDRYLANRASALNQITLKPTPGKEENSVVALTIFRIAEESPMFMAGFRKEDHILKVNGTAVTTLERAVNLIHEIEACSRLTVQVQRGDQIIDYQFDFE